jgi:hypothetical protein
MSFPDFVVVVLYSIICIAGIFGNFVVIYVILCSSSVQYAALNLYKKRLEISKRLRGSLNIKRRKKSFFFSPNQSELKILGKLLNIEKTPHKLSIINSICVSCDVEPTTTQTNEPSLIPISKHSLHTIENKSTLTTTTTTTTITSKLLDDGSRSRSTATQIDMANDNSSFVQRVVNSIFSRRFSITNCYLLSLAATDSIFLMLIPLIIITTKFKKWIFGYFMCKIFFSLEYFCKFNAAFTIVLLSYDRWLAVKYALKTSRYRRLSVTKLLISMVWSLSLILTIPVIIYTNETVDDTYANDTIVTTNETIYSCYLDWPQAWGDRLKYLDDRHFTPLTAFQVFVFSFNFLFPVVVITFFYIQVIKHIKKKNSSLVQSQNRLKSYKKVTKMVLAVIGCYIVCKLSTLRHDLLKDFLNSLLFFFFFFFFDT